MKQAQLKAADSMDESALSQDRLADSCERLAATSPNKDYHLERAQRHRRMAEDDRQLAGGTAADRRPILTRSEGPYDGDCVVVPAGIEPATFRV